MRNYADLVFCTLPETRLAAVDIVELADTCFECAKIYEDQLIPEVGDVQAADASLATEDGSEGNADPKVKAWSWSSESI